MDATENTPVSLTDEDMASTRHVTRRSLLSTTRFGLGLGVAAVVFGGAALGARPAHAASDRANTYDNDDSDRRRSTDND